MLSPDGPRVGGCTLSAPRGRMPSGYLLGVRAPAQAGGALGSFLADLLADDPIVVDEKG